MKIQVWVSLVFLFLSSGSGAENMAKTNADPEAIDDSVQDPRVFIPAKTFVEIESYNGKTGLYHLKRPDFPKVNVYYATAADLVAAIKSLNAAELAKNPSKIVNTGFSLDEDLPLVDPSAGMGKNH